MNAIQAIQAALASTQGILKMFVADLSDSDILVRPVPGANHIAWQIGHLIQAEIILVKSQAFPEAGYPALPANFDTQHSKDTASTEPAVGFLTKAEYLNLFDSIRQATVNMAGKLSESDLDKATQGPLAGFAPTLGAFLILVSNHTLMHAGQFTVIRRKLGKPVLF